MQQFLQATGDTSQTIDVFLPDSSSTTGAGLAALAFNTSNLKCYYRKGATGTVTAITLATQTVSGAWSSGGFVETDASNMKGMYRFDIPDIVLAAAGKAFLFFYGATNLAPVPVQIQISAPVNVTAWSGTAVKTPTAAGVPEVCLTDAVSHGGTLGNSTATLALSRANITSQTSNTSALTLGGNGTGDGLRSSGGLTGNGAYLIGGATSGAGLLSTTTSGPCISLQPTGDAGIYVFGNGANSAMLLIPGTTGHGIDVRGGATSGDAISASAIGSGRGVNAVGAGASNAGIRAKGANGVTTSAAGPGIDAVGGNATTSAGGTSNAGIKATGGSGAASTNGAGNGVTLAGGGTTTVSAGNGFATDTINVSSTTTLTGAVLLGSTLTVTGATVLAAVSGTTLTLSGAVLLSSTLTVAGTTTLGNLGMVAFSCTTLTASGAVLFQSTFSTTGTTTFNAFAISNAFTVAGATTLSGAVLATNASNDIRGVTATVTGTVTLAASQAFNNTGTWTGNIVGTLSTLTTYTGNTPQTGDSFTRIGANGAGLTAVALTGTQTFNNTGTWTGNIVGTLSTLTTYTGNTVQTGDSFARIGANGAGLTSLAPASTALSTAVWTAPPTGFLAATFPSAIGDATITNQSTINSNVLSAISAIAGVQSDTDNIQTRLPAALVSGRMDSSVGSYPGNTAQTGDAYANLTGTVDPALVKILAAVYDSATGSGGDTLALSNGATQTFNTSTGSRTTA